MSEKKKKLQKQEALKGSNDLKALIKECPQAVQDYIAKIENSFVQFQQKEQAYINAIRVLKTV